MTRRIAALLEQGVALHRQGRIGDAARQYRQILDLDAAHFDALHLLGVVHLQAGDPGAALALLEQAARLRPQNADVLVNFGNALRESGRPQRALAALDRALHLKPDAPQAHYNRALALQQLGDIDTALEAYERAIALQPRYLEAVFNRGVALQEARRYAEAEQAFGRALELDPNCPYAAGKRCYTRLMACDWRHFEADRDHLVAAVKAGFRVCDPFSLAGISDDPEAQLRCAQTYAADRFPTASNPLWTGERYRHERIRIAYVSADFHDHPSAYLAAGLFERHDRDRFEVSAIALGPSRSGAMRARLTTAFEHFVEAGDRSARDIARLIRDREIDIAVDLMGYTRGSLPEIFALRPAPVQVAFLGQPTTTGAPHIDYLVADPVVVPEQARRYFSEQLIYLPDSYLVSDDTRARPDAPLSRTDQGLPEKGLVFCCFNNHYKITPQIFAIWMRLLHAVPDSVLWLLADHPQVIANLEAAARAQGVNPSRLVFAPRVGDNREHLGRQRLADLFLDTLPYNAHTTANEALWMGLPLLTCPGETFASRVAASQLCALGMPELVAADLGAYENMALALARDRDRLQALRARLAESRGPRPPFATDRYRRHLEQAFATLWQISQCGAAPRSFSVWAPD